MINSLGDEQELQLLQLQQKGRQLEQENFRLRKELSQLRAVLQFNLHRIEIKTKDSENDYEKEQINYVLSHSSQIKKRQAEVKFQEQPKKLILQGLGQYSNQQNRIEFQTFSYNILLNDELKENPNIIATDSKIEIIFDKQNQKIINN